jgi:hypothetical protein
MTTGLYKSNTNNIDQWLRLLTSDDKSNTNNKDQWLRLLTSDDKLNTTNIHQWLFVVFNLWSEVNNLNH